MSFKVNFLLLIGPLVLCAGLLQAEEKDKETGDKSDQFKREETSDILDHLERKEYPGLRHEPIKLEARKPVEYTIKLEEKKKPSINCHADITIGYLQFNTKARVDAAIENHDCAASSGQYEVQLQIVDKNGDVQTIEHVESWTRGNETPINSRKFYNIGKNVELLRTTIRRVTCTCTPVETR